MHPRQPEKGPRKKQKKRTTFDRAARPYRFALQARACTDALAAHVRVALDQDPNQVLVSLDGRSAYDSVSPTSFLTAFKSATPELLPFLRLFHGRPSTYCWWEKSRQCRDSAQGEGWEQGEPLAPALLALGQHAALCEGTLAGAAESHSVRKRSFHCAEQLCLQDTRQYHAIQPQSHGGYSRAAASLRHRLADVVAAAA